MRGREKKLTETDSDFTVFQCFIEIIVNQRNVVRFSTLSAVSSGNNRTLDIIKKILCIEEQQGFKKQTSISFVSMGTAFLEFFLK